MEVEYKLQILVTWFITGFTLVTFNTVLTSIVLILTAMYWAQKNYKAYRRRNEKEKED